MLGTNQARFSICLGFFLVVSFHKQANEAVEQFWVIFRRNPVSCHDSFEPMVAVTFFFLWTRLFHAIDIGMPRLAKYRVDGSHDISAWEAEGWFRVEVMYYLVPLFALDHLYPRRDVKLREAAPSIERIILEVCACLIVYDAVFFAVHLAMHHVPALRAMHARHHMLGAHTRACDATRVSFPEQVLLVSSAVIAVNVTRSHALSRFLFNVVITYMVTEIHAGYDFPWMMHNVVPFGLLGGSKRHHYHHSKGSRYYQQFFTYLDNAYDWMMGKREPQIHEHVKCQ